MKGTFQDEFGYPVENTSKHPVLFATIVFLPEASITNFAANDWPQPAQAV